MLVILDIAKLAQIIYGMYVNDLSSEFNTSLDSSTPTSLEDIFAIAKYVVNSSSIVRKTDLLTFLDAVDSYSGTAEGLENVVISQKDALVEIIPFKVSVIGGYITGGLIEDSLSVIAEENQSNLGHYIFSNTPTGQLSASGSMFEANSLVSNQMPLKAPELSSVISPITTLLLDFQTCR